MKKEFNKESILKALKVLDSIAEKSFELIIAGGSAMICSYRFPLGTTDIAPLLEKLN